MNPIRVKRSLAHSLTGTCAALVLSQPVFNPVLLSQQSGNVSGTVSAANNMPIAEATIRVIGTDLSTLSRADGVFHVARVPAGVQTLEARMLGYAPTLIRVDLAAGATLRLALVLEPISLDTVKIEANADFSPGMGAFDERRERGSGRFFGREDIRKMQARQVTDILRRVPGMRIQTTSGGFGGNHTAQTGRAGSRTCPMAYYVNGTSFPLAREASINDYMTPEEVVAIEVYLGSAQLPAVFNSTASTSRCGVVVIWTRNGADARVSR